MDPTEFESTCFTIFAVLGAITFLFALKYTAKYSTYVAFILPVSVYIIGGPVIRLMISILALCMPFYCLRQHRHGFRGAGQR